MKIKSLRHNKLLTVILLMLFSLSITSVGVAKASLNSVNVVLSSQVPSASSVTHTFHMKPSINTAIKQVSVKYCTQAGTWGSTCTDIGGLALPASGSNVTLTGFGSTTGTSTKVGNNQENFVITTPASETVGTDHQVAIAAVTNPNATGIYYARIQTYSDSGTTVIDEADIAFAMIPAVSMSASNLESLTFTINAVNASQALINAVGNTDAATTVAPNTVPFGNFKAARASTNLAHRVMVATNGSGGYTMTLVEDQLLTSAANTIADFGTTGNGAGTAWTEATSTGFGINAKSVSGTEVSTTTFGTSTAQANTLYKAITAGTPVTIASAAGVTGGYYAEVNYRVAVPLTLPAGNYTNTLTYNIFSTY